MKREIKFRAWNRIGVPYMSPVGELRLETEKTALIYTPIQADEEGNVDWTGDLVPLENLELMQFTGLLDKGGKEIYENDIVWLTRSYGANITGKIFYDNDFACYRIEGDNITDWVDRKGCFEIIGNIYENPELI